MKAKDIVKALRENHEPLGRQWAFFEELRAGTGWSHKPNNPEQRFDAYAINLYPSNNFKTIAYEVKISRGDFLHEIKHPEKRQQALSLSNEFYFATPEGLVKIDEIPVECGLIEVRKVDNQTFLYCVKPAPKREISQPHWQFLASIARRCMKSEAKQGELV